MNRNHKVYLSLALIILLAFLVSQSIKIEDVNDIFWNFPKPQIILLVCLSLAISFLKAWRFLLLLHNTNIPITLWDASKVYLASQTTTPLPGGETLRAILVHHETEVPIKSTASAIITQGFLEIASASVIMIIGSFYYPQVRISGFIMLFFLVFSATILLNQKIFLYILKKVPNKHLFAKSRSRLKLIQKGFLANVYGSHHSIYKTFLVSIGTHLLGGLLIFAIAQSYNVPLNYFVALFIYSAAIVIQSLVAIVPAGLGVTEGGLTGLLMLNNVSFELSVAIVVIYRIVTLLFTIMIGLIFFLIFYAYELLLANKGVSPKKI